MVEEWCAAKMATQKWNCGKAIISLRVATQRCWTDDSVRAMKREPEPSKIQAFLICLFLLIAAASSEV